MTNIQKVRALCQDTPVYQMEDLNVGEPPEETAYQLSYFPVQTTTVNITDSNGGVISSFTVDEESGVITLPAAPDPQTYRVKYKHTLLTDDAIQVFLDLEESNIRLAAAQALDSIASNQALILKKIKTLDLQTDGPALADSLRQHAQSLKDAVIENDSSWDVAEQINDYAGWEEKILKDIMRES